MTAPAAEGVRVPWDDVPAEVRRGVEALCGSPVVTAATQRGGFSPGLAARVVCASGRRFFVKAVDEGVNPFSAQMHRDEARALAALEPVVASGALPAPAPVGAVELAGWVALVLADVDGTVPELPWREPDLDAVLAAVERVHAVEAPDGLPAAEVALADELTGWRVLREDAPPALDAWSGAHLDELADLEVVWPAAAQGDRLVHTDLRADNLLLTADGAVVVDWAQACRAAPLLDLVLFAPSVAMQGGPPPAEVLARTAVGRDADREQLAPLVCAFAGFLTQRSLLPSPPGLPTLRGFQAAQAVHARRWLADLLE